MATTIWSANLGTVSNFAQGFSLRTTCENLLGGAAAQMLSITIGQQTGGSGTGAFDVYRASIMVVGASTPPAADGPYFQLFSGGSPSWSLAAGGTLVLDPVGPMTFSSSAKLLIDFDLETGGSGCSTNNSSFIGGVTGNFWYAGTTTPPGEFDKTTTLAGTYTPISTQVTNVLKIEVQDLAGTLMGQICL